MTVPEGARARPPGAASGALRSLLSGWAEMGLLDGRSERSNTRHLSLHWKADSYTYPNGMVIADPVELKPGRKDTVTNPLLLAEVLSDSTEKYDRGEKFEAYRTLASLQEYLLIDQYRPHVEQYVKQSEHQWLFTEYTDLATRVQLASIPVELALQDLYQGVISAET